MEVCTSLSNVDKNQLYQWAVTAKEYAFSTGLCFKHPDDPSNPDRVMHAPFMLFPSPVPRQCFKTAEDIQETANLLMHKVAHDHEFLTECFQSALEVDDFMRKLWNIYTTVRSEGIAQPISLSLGRNDYMFDTGHPDENVNPSQLRLKQIEFNTMAAGMHGLSQEANKLHRRILHITDNENKMKNVPEFSCNHANKGFGEAVVKAWTLYGNPQSVVLMLVMEPDFNTYDQRHLEYEIIRENKDITVIRRTMIDMKNNAELGHNKELIVDGMEVSVVYYRTGYSPHQLDSINAWDTRLLIERSRAIKCPNIQYFLAGMKKVQQMVTLPGRVEKYIEDPTMVRAIRETFAGQYTLDRGEEGNANIERILADPHRYVLKPQREGGGNNIYGDDITAVLNNIKDTDERNAYIGMDRIHPARFENIFVRSGQELKASNDVVSELGIYGSFVGTPTEIYHNKQYGYYLRSKSVGIDEGGVAVGISAMDTPYLVD